MKFNIFYFKLNIDREKNEKKPFQSENFGKF